MKPSILLELAYLVFFAMTVLFSFLINGLLLRFSRTLGSRQIQHRKSIRWSSAVKPSVGGLSFYILFLISISIYGIYDFHNSENLSLQLLGLVFAVTTGFLLGLADDAYDTIPILKFSGQLLCGIFLVATDMVIPATGIYWVDVLITLVWVVGIMNSINMLDNMDGLAGIVTVFIALACILVLFVEQQLFSFHTILLLGMLGAVTGFLFHNWPPARIYMGDTGSQFLGSFIAAITIPILWKYHDPAGGYIQFSQYLVPLVAFAVPILDTATVFIRRILNGHSPFIGGKDHISHHFVYAGLSERYTILVLGGMAFLSSLLTAILVYQRETLSIGWIMVWYGLFALVFIAVQLVYNTGHQKQLHHHLSAGKMTGEDASGSKSKSA